MLTDSICDSICLNDSRSLSILLDKFLYGILMR